MALTAKQIMIMDVIVRGNSDGSVADLDQILERLDYQTTKQSLQFSIRALIAHGLIEKKGVETRRGRKRVLITATPEGVALVRAQPSNTASFIESPESDYLREV